MQVERRDLLKMRGAGACLGTMGCAPAAVDGASKKPNIVLCMADDQGWGDMGYRDHPVLKTPNFDAMAREGMRFDRFYAAAPVCSPTRGSVMTGRHPNRFGCFKWGYTLRPQEITVAEALKSAGYVTGHFGKWHLGSARKGSPVNPGASGFDEWFSAPNFFDNNPILSREGTAVQTKGESSMVTADAAIEFIRKHAGEEQPFLAVVWFGSPHRPHRAAEEDRALYDSEEEKLQHFYGEITGMDRAFGKLRDELRTLDIHEDTVLWYCSDNGGLPEGDATGGRGHKGQVYEGGLRVPALLEWPARCPAPKPNSLPCNTTDIYPTVLDIAGVDMPGQPPLDGVSLVPLLDERMENRSKPMGFWDYPAKGYGTPSAEWMAELLKAQKEGKEPEDPEKLRLNAAEIGKSYPEDSFPGHSAWLDWPWKLHRIQKEEKAPKIELYNLSQDPKEEQNLAGEKEDRTTAMRAALEGWLVSVVRSLNGEDYR